MDEQRYTVGQAAAITGVKYYVMRYWEEELDLKIGRNELGHRYYTSRDIRLFISINELKNRGLQLKAIRQLLPQLLENTEGSLDKIPLPDGAEEWEHQETPNARNHIEEKEVEICTGEVCDNIPEEKSPGEKKKMQEFQRILEKLINEEIRRKTTGEYRCRTLDESIRRHQLARREAAAACDGKKSRRNRKGRR